MNLAQNIWRSAHLLLAAISGVFLLLVTITGMILSVEPIYLASGDLQQQGLEEYSIAALLDNIQGSGEEYLEIAIDNNGFIRAYTFESEDGSYFISKQGEKIQSDYHRSPVFEVVTNFHRSLFLKSTGRLLIGVVSFLLVLIALSGLMLAIKKLGFVKYFLPFERVGKHPYYHTYFGRIFIIPILVIAITGVILSLARFEIIETGVVSSGLGKEYSSHLPTSWGEFEVFNKIPLSEVERIEFPFSSDEEDYFLITLKDKKLSVQQYTGEVIEAQMFAKGKSWINNSLRLHTGAQLPYWSVVLFVASISVLYFMYSGFIIAYSRLVGKTRNKVLASEAEVVLLIGSENGKTQQFAKLLFTALLEQGVKVYSCELNKFQSFPKMQELMILTSTYGNGEPPANAQRFFGLLRTHLPSQSVRYSVVGFGSKKYPKFCQFAKDVYKELKLIPNFTEGVAPVYIDKNNFLVFKNWMNEWSNMVGVSLSIPDSIQIIKKQKYRFKVEQNILIDDQYSTTAFLELSCSKLSKIEAGDLLALQNDGMKEERLYSVGKKHNGNILLAVKKHSLGKASTFLSSLAAQEVFFATHRINPHFRLPLDAPKIVMIANGTGIAPFIGMIHDKKFQGERDLYWGIRTRAAMSPLMEELEVAQQNGFLNRSYIAHSKESARYSYVQDAIMDNSEQIAKDLIQGAVFMFCGSLAMQNSVESALKQIIELYNLHSLEEFKVKGQILSDCY